MLGFTIDSIKLFLSPEKLRDYDFEYLKRMIGAEYKELEQYKGQYKGFYKNFHINFSKTSGIYIAGSITNFYVGAGSLLPYDQLKNAIDKLGKELRLDLHSARLYRVDLALNIETDNPVSQYTHHLFTDLSRFKRLEQDKGVLFKTTETAFSIYNKSLELEEKKGIKNVKDVLRLEIRLLCSVSKKLGVKEMEMKDLYNPRNYNKLAELFCKYYQKIKKQTIPKNIHELSEITPRILSKCLIQAGIGHIFQDEKEVYRFIEQEDRQGKFKNANDKSRSRKLIDNLSDNKQISKLHPLIEEINKKVEVHISELKKQLSIKIKPK